MPPDPINGRRLAHSWTDEQRIALALLHKIYDVTNEQRVKVWSHIYKDVLQSEGFRDGYPVPAMVSQVAELKRGGTGSRPWQSVMQKPMCQVSRLFAKERYLIED